MIWLHELHLPILKITTTPPFSVAQEAFETGGGGLDPPKDPNFSSPTFFIRKPYPMIVY